MAVTTILQKSDNLVSIAQEFWKLLGHIFKMRSIQEGFSIFLKHVGLSITLVKLWLEQRFWTDESSTPALKLPKNRS